MAYKQQVRSRTAETEPETQEDGADLRDEALAADVDAMLDDIDCCLKDHAEETETAEKQARAAAAAEWNAIFDRCGAACTDYGAAGCRHAAEMSAWVKAHAVKFFWCCGQPVFDEDDDALMAAAGAVRGLR